MRFLIVISLFVFLACSNVNDKSHRAKGNENVTIFFVNDVHGQIENFAKVKHIADKAKKTSNVILVCSGDIFSGNPVVDQYEPQGFPIIDLMNRTGFDVISMGNHEFDYGSEILKDRMKQSQFDWICANVDMSNSDLPEPLEYTTINAGQFDITFLGLIETNGKQGAVIPSTHPGHIKHFKFQLPQEVVPNYAKLKTIEGSDVYIALTHLGSNDNFGDFQLAERFPYFDLVIGGHSHQQIDTTINNISVFQSGSYLNYLGTIELQFADNQISDITYKQIDLNAYEEYDEELQSAIKNYYDTMRPVLNEVIGNSARYHDQNTVGCFMAEALKSSTGADVSFQNTGGVRSTLNEGEITVEKIYQIDPFSNSMMLYKKSVEEIETFLEKSHSGFYYNGLIIRNENNTAQLYSSTADLLDDTIMLSIAVNDYVAAVHSSFFGQNGKSLSYTSADAIISYLRDTNTEINYPACDCYFRFE